MSHAASVGLASPKYVAAERWLCGGRSDDDRPSKSSLTDSARSRAAPALRRTADRAKAHRPMPERENVTRDMGKRIRSMCEMLNYVEI